MKIKSKVDAIGLFLIFIGLPIILYFIGGCIGLRDAGISLLIIIFCAVIMGEDPASKKRIDNWKKDAEKQ